MKKFLITILILLNAQFAFGEASRSFDGVGDRLGQTNIFDVTTGNISLCIYSKLTEDASADGLIGKRNTADPNGSGYLLYQNTSDLIVANFNANATATTDCDGIWCATCATWDGTNDIAIIYTNGVAEQTTDTSGIGSLTTGSFLRMGADGAATAGYDATGLLSNGTVFNTVILTAVQVNEWMWRPELSGIAVNMLIPIWGESPEIDLSANDDTAALTGTNTPSSDGPPIMIGDAAI